jgi:hypothetical protein
MRISGFHSCPQETEMLFAFGLADSVMGLGSQVTKKMAARDFLSINFSPQQ